MNSKAVLAFLTGAMQENPTDEQIEELIEFLQSKIKVSRRTKDILEFLQERRRDTAHRVWKLDSAKAIRKYVMYEDEWAKEILYFLDMNVVTDINWQWIYEELTNGSTSS